MSRIFVTSDWHFCHDKAFLYVPRGFASAGEMNEIIIQNYNSVVSDNDDVYMLGDAILSNTEKGLECMRRLRGRLHLIRGNHDSAKRWEEYAKLKNVTELAAACYLKVGKYNFFLSHFPCITSNFDDDKAPWQRTLSISGHTHSKELFNAKTSYNACVDAHNNFPVDIEAVIESFKKLNFTSSIPLPTTHNSFILATNPFVSRNCDKCVNYLTRCPGPSSLSPSTCPPPHTYKRDPPDEGYYG